MPPSAAMAPDVDRRIAACERDAAVAASESRQSNKTLSDHSHEIKVVRDRIGGVEREMVEAKGDRRRLAEKLDEHVTETRRGIASVETKVDKLSESVMRIDKVLIRIGIIVALLGGSAFGVKELLAMFGVGG